LKTKNWHADCGMQLNYCKKLIVDREVSGLPG
jgi:hypothetical protein